MTNPHYINFVHNNTNNVFISKSVLSSTQNEIELLKRTLLVQELSKLKQTYPYLKQRRGLFLKFDGPYCAMS